MKDFDINLARKGHPVCTRDGRPVRIVCYDVKDNDYPILALVSERGLEIPKQYTKEGFYVKDRPVNGYNLMMVPEKHEGWTHVYSRDNGRKPVVGRAIFSTKEEAIAAAKQHKTEDRIIDTIKIEWEE